MLPLIHLIVPTPKLHINSQPQYLCYLQTQHVAKPTTLQTYNNKGRRKIRFAGVIWLDLIHALHLLSIKLTSWNWCCIDQAIMKDEQHSNWIWTLSDSVIINGSACVLNRQKSTRSPLIVIPLLSPFMMICAVGNCLRVCAPALLWRLALLCSDSTWAL